MVATSSSSTYLLGSNPVTIAAGVTINPLSSYAVSGGAGSILTNYGVLSSHGAAGVDVGAGSTVTNSGAIASALGAGIVLGASSMLTNGASGSIASATNVGVSIGSGSTVTNAGLIDAISFGGSGTFNNESGGRITVSGAAPQTPVVAYAGLLLVQNAGTISATGVDAQGVALYDGGGVTNLTGGTISASGSNDQGIFLGDGGVVQNAAGGLITSEFAPIYIAGGSATISNSGTIDGSGGITAVIPTLHHLHSVSAAAASTVVNAGTIDGAGGDAISLLSGFSNRVVA